jgi:hypothetical protein|tara:strand:+ start:3772 stop:8232 length:4461 start_codon:yes stop_codon:yes gene_type:complete
MAEELEITPFTSAQDQISDSYVRNRSVRNRYETTPTFIEEEEKEVLREETAPIKEQEANALANNQKSLLSEVGEFVTNIGIGAVKAVEETAQVFGARDNILNIPDAEDTGDQIARGFGQALTFFIPAAGGVRAGLKLAGLFQKSSKLTKAGEIVAGSAAGALTDAFAFDPRDPNAADLALAIGVISKDSKVGAATREFLAQNDDDPEAVARFKAALSGLFAGAVVDQLIRGAGYLRRSYKGTKELEEAAKEFSDNTVEGLHRARQGADPEKLEEVSNLLPTPEEGLAQAQKRFENDPMQKLENPSEAAFPTSGAAGSRQTSGDLPQPIQDMLNKLANNETVPDQGLDEILSVNLLKSGESLDIKNVIQFASRFIKVKEITKPNRPLESYDSVIGDMVDDFVITDPEGKFNILSDIRRVTANVDEARQYVGTVKALMAVQTRALVKLNTTFAQNPTKANREALMTGWQVEKELLFNGSGLSKASSDLLNSYKKTVRAINDEAVIKKELQKRVVTPDIEVSRMAAVHASKLDRMDNLALKELKDELAGSSSDVKLDKAFDDAVEVTGKVGRKNIKSKPTGKKRGFKIHKLETDTGKRVSKELARLEKLRKSARAPERGAPFPKNKPLKDVASPAQLARIKKAKDALQKVRLDRDTTLNKFNRNNKEQLRLRKQFEKLSKEIEALRAGIDPRKAQGAKKGTTVDIEKLKAEKARLLAKLKPLNAVEKRVEALNKQLETLLQKRINKDFDRATPIERTQIEQDIQKSIKFQRDKLNTSRLESEITEAFTRKAEAAELADIDKMSFNQMKTRLSNMDRGLGAKTFRVLSEIYINGLLSSLKTIAEVNPLGTTSAVIADIFDRSMAAFKTFRTGKGDIDFKEVTTLGWNYVAAIPEFGRLLKKAMIHGPSDPNFKLDYMNVRDQAISKEAFNLGGNLGKAVDYLGTAVNMPGRLLLATDEAYKGLINRGQRKALAYRKARNEVGSTGTEANQAAISKRTQEIMDDLNSHEDIILQAREAGDKLTFTNPLHDREVTDAFGNTRTVPGAAKSIKQFIDQRDPTGISRIFIPFFQTPANIFNFTFERTPGINRISETLKQELKSTNLGVKELAEARMSSAYVIWTGFFGLAFAGNFTGAPPRDPNLRKTMEADGTRWNSWNAGSDSMLGIDEGWRSYSNLDPFGLILQSASILSNMAKSMVNLHGKYERGDDSDAIEEKYNEVLMAGVVGMSELLKDKSYVAGVMELMDIFSTDGRGIDRTLQRAVGFAMPNVSLYSSLRRNITRGIDTTKPERLQKTEPEGETPFDKTVSSITGEIARIYQEANDQVMFGWGNRPAMKDLAGNTVEYPGTNQEFSVTRNIRNSMLLGFPEYRKSSSPLINRLAELESKIAQPSSLKHVNGVTLTDEEKIYIINEWTDMNKSLNKLVTNKSFLKYPEGTQKFLIEEEIKENKKIAIDMAMVKFEDRLGEAATDAVVNLMNRKTTEKVTTGFQPPL